MEGRRFQDERRKLIEMHGQRCAYCHQYFHDSELSVDHIVPRALSGKSIVRNMQLLCYPCHKMKDQPCTKLIQMNACIIKPRVLSNYLSSDSKSNIANEPRPIQIAQPTPPLLTLYPIPLPQFVHNTSPTFAPTENIF
ncbi:MAG TPA: HNH endonuclease signature motif containing protein [Nitrososphaeraceae archaeon]